MIEAKAIIRWVPREEGGRQRPPQPATGYSAPLRFRDQPREREAWSTRLLSAKQLKSRGYISATIAFVMPNAPHGRLKRETAFEWVEGSQTVARGVVLPAMMRVPMRLTDFERALLR